ncbi:MAG: hypothetical protein MZU91_12600 [Desulfosudis oleivorans]|nr:hypothetical protein [Desulfosudis oleivorans]
MHDFSCPVVHRSGSQCVFCCMVTDPPPQAKDGLMKVRTGNGGTPCLAHLAYPRPRSQRGPAEVGLGNGARDPASGRRAQAGAAPMQVQGSAAAVASASRPFTLPDLIAYALAHNPEAGGGRLRRRGGGRPHPRCRRGTLRRALSARGRLFELRSRPAADRRRFNGELGAVRRQRPRSPTSCCACRCTPAAG